MKRNQFRNILAGILVTGSSVLVAPVAYAFDGVDTRMARELGGDSTHSRADVSDELPSRSVDSKSVSPVSYHDDYFDDASQGCQSCEMPPELCGCQKQSGGLLFNHIAKKRANECLAPWWSHRTGAFGEFLFLRPGSSDLIYATEQTDPDPDVASPTGPIGTTDLDAETGFRVGFTLAASECSSIVTSYARWDGSTNSRLEANGANVLSSNVIHPSTLTSGAASLEATAIHDMNFQNVDLLYRHICRKSDTMALNWLAGVRYGNMEQQLSVDQTVSVATGLTNVTTDIDFDGFGISGGLDFETYSCTTGLSLYGRTLASLLAGEWNATYRQTNQLGGGVVANDYEDFHATPVLDAELGVRWMAKKRHFMISSGFLMSGWYESLTTRSYIDSVRAGQLTDAGETMTFSGLTARAEWRF